MKYKLSKTDIIILKEKAPPLIFHLLYFLFAVTFCFLYYLKIVKGAGFNSPNSINAVLTFETVKPFQFRLLVPFIFKILFLFKFIPQKAIFMSYCGVIVYFIILAYYYLISEYFENKLTNLFLAPLILYPMTWNYILLNETFQYYDFTTILLFTLGLYFILKNNYKLLLIVFIIGLINKETIAYLIFAYVLFNYKKAFTRTVIINTFLLALSFIAVKVLLYLIFKSNPGDPVEICFFRNQEILSNLFKDRVYAKDFFLNFGGWYVFIILFFLTGGVKRFASVSDRSKIYIHLAIIPFVIFGIFIIYFSEVRVYSELMPMVTTLFLIYSGINKKSPLKFIENKNIAQQKEK